MTGIQNRLANLGYEVGFADGIFGPKTRAALINFLLDRGKLELFGDGAVGPDLISFLRTEHDWHRLSGEPERPDPSRAEPDYSRIPGVCDLPLPDEDILPHVPGEE
ncbi:peptidoglycan-binding domain-containing protein [Sphingomonas sp.]|uniref:peptidoglycan-binding domain-containing protein n=1 Tax=Sphingomonas sp. TaxID=28214 RepID=UPI0039C8EE91